MLFRLKQPFLNIYNLTITLVSLILLSLIAYFVNDNILFLIFLIIPFIVISLIVDYRVLFIVLLLSLPFSTNFRIGDLNLTIGLPSEPLIGLLAVLATIILFLQDKKSAIVSHTFSKIVFFYWITLVISFVFSTMPEVSIKTLIVATCYILVFYYLLAYYLLKNEGKFITILFCYAVSLFIVVFNTTWKHYDYGFNKNYSGTAVLPFFSDHTIYGACLAFMVPVMGILYMKAKIFKLNYIQKNTAGLFALFFLAGVYFSHSRATWVSLASIIVALIILKFRLSFKSIMVVLVVLLITAFINIEALMPVLVKNKYDSKAKRANLEAQIKSVTNIKNDVSNAERVNRWLCAVRMFKEKPYTGYGVGTYQFKYIPFQKGYEMTEISITSPKNNYDQGMGGTAHSEYLLSLSESGLFSFITLIIIVLYTVYLGMKLFYSSIIESHRYIALMVLLGLITYFIHGVFNNFLTTDKAAFLVWGGIAILCVLDIQNKKITTNEQI